MSRARFPSLDDLSPDKPAMRACDHPGCAAEGAFRAPRDRNRLGDAGTYYWFCLDHVRNYNAAWNYYAGMNEREIEAELRRDSVWQRPTWPLGWRIAGRQFYDPLNLYAGRHEQNRADGPGMGGRAEKRFLSEDERALLIFDIEPPFTLIELKTRYKILVKMHHPDANGGDKDAEERLKAITQAYALLKTRYFS